MPLNAVQRETLFNSVATCVDRILGSSVDRLKIIEWLNQCISDAKLTIEEAVVVLKKYPALTKGLSEIATVPGIVRGYWRQLSMYMDSNQAVSADLLKELYDFNNYNPVLIAEMRLFENKIDNVPELSSIKNDLLRLREAYLEMTPLASCSYGEASYTYYFRIGQVPFNLENSGPLPLKGEIQEDINRLVVDRLEQDDKYQSYIADKEKSRLEMEAMAASARTETDRARLAASVFLDERAEQQRRELFKQAVLSNYRNFESRASLSQPVSVSDLFLQNFSTSSKGASSSKSDRLFQMQHVAINNRITDMMRQATVHMSKVDLTLKQSKDFLNLRVAECCKVLLDVQLTLVDVCLTEYSRKATFHAEDFDYLYKRKLQDTYDTFLNDMVAKWMFEKRWLSDGTGRPLTEEMFKLLSEQLCGDIHGAMESELQGFRSFQVKSLNDINQLKKELPKKIKKQVVKAAKCKKNWIEMSAPLMDIADQCSKLRSLRAQIQKSKCNLESFNRILIALIKIMRSVECTTLDQAGFNLFHYACWGGDLKLIQELLSQGAKLELVDVEGNSIIHLVVENETSTTIELLEMLMKQPFFAKVSILDLKNKRDKTPLHVAAALGNLMVVQWIVGKSQAVLNLGVTDRAGMTPLHYAAREGKENVVEYLLTLGAANSMKEDKNHPLMLAIQYEHINVARLFYKQGIWLVPNQIDILQKMAENSHAPSNIANCLAIPLIEGLNDLAKFKPFLNSHAQLTTPCLQPPPVAVVVNTALNIQEGAQESGLFFDYGHGAANNRTPEPAVAPLRPVLPNAGSSIGTL